MQSEGDVPGRKYGEGGGEGMKKRTLQNNVRIFSKTEISLPR